MRGVKKRKLHTRNHLHVLRNVKLQDHVQNISTYVPVVSSSYLPGGVGQAPGIA